jgi:hypothetical protein
VATQRDDNGFLSTPTERLSTQTVPLSSEIVNLGKAGPNDWWADHHLATWRLSARSEGASAHWTPRPLAAASDEVPSPERSRKRPIR